jgi:PPOX class probable F420-dependent enzyme
MKLGRDEARRRFAAARVARMATVDVAGIPHLVPVTFAVVEDAITFAVDHKPKSTMDLRRVRNIRSTGRVSLLVDHYDDADWTRLWWVRADGVGEVVTDRPERAVLLDALRSKYPQYQDRLPAGAVLCLTVVWSGWTAT